MPHCSVLLLLLLERMASVLDVHTHLCIICVFDVAFSGELASLCWKPNCWASSNWLGIFTFDCIGMKSAISVVNFSFLKNHYLLSKLEI